MDDKTIFNEMFTDAYNAKEEDVQKKSFVEDNTHNCLIVEKLKWKVIDPQFHLNIDIMWTCQVTLLSQKFAKQKTMQKY